MRYSAAEVERSSESEYVKISRLKAQDTKLFVDLELPRKVEKYFFKSSFAIDYGTNIKVDESLMVIPAISLVAPVVWAVGADLIVDKLDLSYLESLGRIRKLFEGWFPQFASQSKMKIGEIVSNQIEKKKNALLFSAGLDSLASYIRIKEDHPTLITLLKHDDHPRYYEKVQNTLENLAKDDKVDIHFIWSDIWDARSNTIDNKSLENDFHIHGWWEEISHGLITLGLCAPITVADSIGTVKMASSFDRDQRPLPHGSHFLTHTKLSWANIDIVYDSADFTRQRKIREILKGNKKYYKYLRLCVDPSHFRINDSDEYPRNCGHCEKCLRTITGLILEGIDLNKCNFEVKNGVLDMIRQSFLNGSINVSLHNSQFWEEFQEYYRKAGATSLDNNAAQLYSAREFFEWFKDFDLASYKPNIYNILKREVSFSLRHRGFYPTVKQAVGYLSTKGKNKMHGGKRDNRDK